VATRAAGASLFRSELGRKARLALVGLKFAVQVQARLFRFSHTTDGVTVRMSVAWGGVRRAVRAALPGTVVVVCCSDKDEEGTVWLATR